MNEARFFKVDSFSTEGIIYTVRQLPTGEWRCECPAFVFGKNKMCNHIRKVRHLKMKRHGSKKLDKGKRPDNS
jgi:hypothetical protein